MPKSKTGIYSVFYTHIYSVFYTHTPTHGSFKIQITDIYPQIGAVFKKNRHLLLVSKIPVFKIKPTLIIYCRRRFKKSSRADRVLSTRSRPYPLARTARMQPPLVVSQLSLCISSRNSLFPSHSRLSLSLSSPRTNTDGVAGPAGSGATLPHSGVTLLHSGVSSGASLPTGGGISRIRRHSSKWCGQRPPMVRELWVASPQCGLGGRPPPRRDGRCSGRPLSGRDGLPHPVMRRAASPWRGAAGVGGGWVASPPRRRP